jgi:hypothetical protein
LSYWRDFRQKNRPRKKERGNYEGKKSLRVDGFMASEQYGSEEVYELFLALSCFFGATILLA